MDWLDLAQGLGVIAGSSVTLVWLGRSLIDRGLDTLVESHKASLQKATAIEVEKLKSSLQTELEKFKSSLQVTAHEMQARSSVLVTRQADTIAETVRLINEADRTCAWYMARVHSGQSPTEEEKMDRGLKAHKAVTDFDQYYADHKMYFATDTCEILDSIVGHFRKAIVRYSIATNVLNRFDMEEEAWNILKEEIPVAREKLVEEFRVLLRVVTQK